MSMLKTSIYSISFILLSFISYSQIGDGKIDLPTLKIRKSGPYVGVQRGNYFVGECGVEFQWKQVKLISASTQALHSGVNYNLNQNVLGYDLGYWIKPSRLGLTYGGNFVLRTDFIHNRFGFAPSVGYKLFGFHLQTGYHFLTSSPNFKNTNTFFVSLRFVLINHRDTKMKH